MVILSWGWGWDGILGTLQMPSSGSAQWGQLFGLLDAWSIARTSRGGGGLWEVFWRADRRSP